MSRKILFSFILFSILFCLSFIGYKTYKVQQIKKESSLKSQALSSLPFHFLKKNDRLAGRPVIVNYFSPDCEHCQYMTKQISSHQSDFAGIQVLMITPDNIDAAKRFQKNYDLENLDFINVGIDSSYAFFKVFGSAMIPSFFVYNSNHKLIRKFDGETKIENLINSLK